MSLTTIAFHEDVFGLHDALIGRNCLYTLRLFIEPGHGVDLRLAHDSGIPNFESQISDYLLSRAVFAGSTQLELNPLLSLDAGRKRVFDFGHFGDQIGSRYQFRRRVTSSNDNM